MTQGRLYMTQGRLYMTQGRLYMTQGRLYMTQGRCDSVVVVCQRYIGGVVVLWWCVRGILAVW